jgi:hypothetical protein
MDGDLFSPIFILGGTIGHDGLSGVPDHSHTDVHIQQPGLRVRGCNLLARGLNKPYECLHLYSSMNMVTQPVIHS